MKKARWRVSHFVRDDHQRPRHLGTEVGQAACGSFISMDDGLKPGGAAGRCERCERRVVAEQDTVGVEP